ncbi:hypothetical protein K469DRAFT_573840, partial [Zopfia rhizophila CBS 207.26]
RATLRARKESRPSNRPYAGLAQVCQQIRDEFRPIYLLNQEIGVDLIETVKYLRYFYPEGKKEEKERRQGNITIAVPGEVQEEEKRQGIDLWPLLDMWANSMRIEGGFGRYLSPNYAPGEDGECKDLYRLFGRRVLPDRSCTRMNRIWRTYLRESHLAEVRIYREIAEVKIPFIHILFKPEFALEWMVRQESVVPAGFLDEIGFSHMEYFDVKVGVVDASVKED